MRSVWLSLLLLALTAAPAPARASIGDEYLTVDSAAAVAQTKAGKVTVRLSPRAYGELGDDRGQVLCRTVGTHSARYWATHDAQVKRTLRLSFKRRTIRFSAPRTRVDVCTLSTPEDGDRSCLPPVRGSDWCAWVAVAFNEDGRRSLDERLRAFDVGGWLYEADQGLAGYAPERVHSADVVALASPDASPPPGKVGYFYVKDQTLVVASLLRDGTRRFVRLDFDSYLFTTNVTAFTAGFADAVVNPTVF